MLYTELLVVLGAGAYAAVDVEVVAGRGDLMVQFAGIGLAMGPPARVRWRVEGVGMAVVRVRRMEGRKKVRRCIVVMEPHLV